MVVEHTANESISAYTSASWREVFHLLEPIVGRSVSEILIEDLRENGIDVSKDGAYILMADVKKTLDWLFGEGSDALLDCLGRHLKSS